MTTIAPPPFDPELAAALAATGQDTVATGITPDTLADARAALLEGVPSVADLAADGTYDVEELAVPGPEGGQDVPLLVIRPRDAVGLRPVVYHTHGGGLIMGNNRFGVDLVLEWARELGLIVVSVGYRLAPEHPFPAGLDDAHAGLRWVHEHAGEIGGDARRIVLAGGSAGGTLAAALAQLTRDRGDVEVLGQLLMYPMLDDRNDSVSVRQMAGIGVWDGISNATGWSAWLAGRPGADAPRYAVPARERDLAGLPPAFLDVGSAETFRDEVVEYAGRIWAAGGEAELHVWPGAFHGFDFLAPQAELSQRARQARLHWLRRLLGE
ncbi:alpha/beta hydrolase [Pseudonocardia zijingensis]|jgi:acetyl esterase/lipase|uniref:Alpha/beta hydrolase n=1 Tax=Pseudonocardia zijingensis TaxID=153376 RepID=A0ABN1P2K3_9PSEU